MRLSCRLPVSDSLACCNLHICRVTASRSPHFRTHQFFYKPVLLLQKLLYLFPRPFYLKIQAYSVFREDFIHPPIESAKMIPDCRKIGENWNYPNCVFSFYETISFLKKWIVFPEKISRVLVSISRPQTRKMKFANVFPGAREHARCIKLVFRAISKNVWYLLFSILKIFLFFSDKTDFFDEGHNW